MTLFPSYNLEIEKLHGKAFDLLTLDLSLEAMLQGGKVLSTHLPSETSLLDYSG